MSQRQTVTVGERSLRVSNLDKVLYPASGTTKADVLRYYLGVAEVMLPHLAGRPVTLRRWPDGVEQGDFFEKRCPSHRPDWLPTTPLGHEGRDRVEHCDLREVAAIVWAANLGALELHVPMGRAPDPSVPTMVVFDLDPGPPAGLVECARLALRLRELLERLELAGYPKTSGGKGLQVYVPLNQDGTTYEQTRAFSHGLGKVLERADPAGVLTVQDRAARTGKVLVDWSQNVLTKTTVCAYSLRGRPRPTVSTPVRWEEVAEVADSGDPDPLVFELDQVLVRVARDGDLFAEVATREQELPRLD